MLTPSKSVSHVAVAIVSQQGRPSRLVLERTHRDRDINYRFRVQIRHRRATYVLYAEGGIAENRTQGSAFLQKPGLPGILMGYKADFAALQAEFHCAGRRDDPALRLRGSRGGDKPIRCDAPLGNRHPIEDGAHWMRPNAEKIRVKFGAAGALNQAR